MTQPDDIADQLARLAAGNDALVGNPRVLNGLATAGASPQQAQAINQFMLGLSGQTQAATTPVGHTTPMPAQTKTATKAIGGTDSNSDSGWFSSVGSFFHHLTHNPVTNNPVTHFTTEPVLNALNAVGNATLTGLGNVTQGFKKDFTDPGSLLKNPFANGNAGSTSATEAAKAAGYDPSNPLSMIAYGASGQAKSDLSDLYATNGTALVDQAIQFNQDPDKFRQQLLFDPNLTEDQRATNIKLFDVNTDEGKRFQNLAIQVAARSDTPGSILTQGIDPLKHPTEKRLTGAGIDIAASFLLDPTLVAGKGVTLYKASQIGLDTIGDESKVRAALTPVADGGKSGLYANQTRNGMISFTSDIKKIVAGQAANATDEERAAAAGALQHIHTATPGLEHLIDDFTGKVRVTGTDAKTGKAIMGEGDAIVDLDGAREYLASKAGIIRLMAGRAGSEIGYMPGQLSKVGAKALRANLNASRVERGAAKTIDLNKKSLLDNFLAAPGDQVDAATGKVIADAAADAAKAGQPVTTSQLASQLRAAAKDAGDERFQSLKGPLGTLRRLSLAKQRATTFLPKTTTFDVSKPGSINDIVNYAKTYLTASDANLFGATYAGADTATRKAMLSGLGLQVAHAAGLGTTEGGRAVLADLSREFSTHQYSVTADKFTDDFTGMERDAALLPSDVNEILTLPSFKELQQQGAKIGVWQNTIGRFGQSAMVDNLTKIVKLLWLIRPANVVRNSGEDLFGAYLRGELSHVLLAKRVAGDAGLLPKRTKLGNAVANPILAVTRMYAQHRINAAAEGLGLDHIARLPADELGEFADNLANLRIGSLVDPNGDKDLSEIHEAGMVPKRLSFNAKRTGFDSKSAEGSIGAIRYSRYLGHVYGGNKELVDTILGHLAPKEGLTPLYRSDVGPENVSTAKPHGLYASIDRPGFESPFHGTSEDFVKEFRGHGLPLSDKRVLKLDETMVTHPSRASGALSGIQFPADSGVAALKKLAPNDFDRLMKASKVSLVKEMTEKFPGHDYTKYHDAYELLMAYGGQLARQKGYHALHLADKTDKNLDEYVALTDEGLPGPMREVGTGTTAQTKPLDERVRDAYYGLAKPTADNPEPMVSIARLRKALPDVPRDDLDGALKKIAREEGDLIPESNQKMLTQEQRDAAIQHGGQEKHLVTMQHRPPTEPGEGDLATASPAARAPKTMDDIIAALRADPRTKQMIRSTHYQDADGNWLKVGLDATGKPLADEDVLAHTQLAKSITNEVKYLLTGQNGEINEKLTDYLTEFGHAPSADWIEHNLTDADRPTSVLAPTFEAVPPKPGVEGWVQAASDLGGKAYGALVERPINRISTMPIFLSNYGKMRVFLEPHEAELIHGGVSAEAADKTVREIAMQMAWTRTAKYIDDPSLRTALDVTGRNFFAFSRATTAFIRRWSTQLVEDPTRLRKAQLVHQAAVRTGVIYKDPNGGENFVYPGSGWAIKHVLDVGNMLGLNLAQVPGVVPNLSSQVGFLNPGLTNPMQMSLTPLANMPLREAEKAFPTHAVAFEKVDRFFNGSAAVGASLKSDLTPSFLRQFAQARDASKDSLTADAVRGAIVSLAAAHQLPGTVLDAQGNPVPTNPAEMQTFLAKLTAQTQNQMMLRATFGLFAPASPGTPSEENDATQADYFYGVQGIHGLDAEWKQMLNDAGGDYAAAIQVWTELHPDKLMFTVPTTEVGAKSAVVQATEASNQWIVNNSDFLKKYNTVGAYFLPQGDQSGEFDTDAYKAELDLGLRQRKETADFANDVATATATQQFFNAISVRDQALTDHVDDPDATKQIKANFSAWQDQFNKFNPLFAETQQDFSAAQNTAAGQLGSLQQLVNDPDVPKDVPKAEVQQMIDAYTTYHQVTDSIVGQTDAATTQRAMVGGNYNAWFQRFLTVHPELGGLYAGVFRTLDNKILDPVGSS